MDLQTYLKDSGERQSAFAARVGTTPATVSRLCNGSLRPALDLAHRIETATEGQVPTEMWLAGEQVDCSATAASEAD